MHTIKLTALCGAMLMIGGLAGAEEKFPTKPIRMLVPFSAGSATDFGAAGAALGAAIQTMRDHEALRFALLFCEPHNFAFYQSRGWHRFEGEVYAEQPEGRVRFEVMSPFIFHIKRSPRQGVIDLCGLPW